METILELKIMLADALSMLERAEIIDFNGHMSARIPGTDHLLINSGVSVRSALTADDIIAIDLDGKPLDGERVPPMEFHLHTEIYRRRPEVNAVVHTHPLWSTLFSMTGEAVHGRPSPARAEPDPRRASSARARPAPWSRSRPASRSSPRA